MKKFSARQKFLKEQTSKDYQVSHEAIEYFFFINSEHCPPVKL